MPWIESVWLMCTATKSSYLFFAPAAMLEGVLAGFLDKHFTALM